MNPELVSRAQMVDAYVLTPMIIIAGVAIAAAMLAFIWKRFKA